MPYAQIPDSVILDDTMTPLARRLYEYLDLKAGTRGYWDDSLAAIARAMGASRSHLGQALHVLIARGFIARETRGHWRSRFVVDREAASAAEPPPRPVRADERRWLVWERDDFRCRNCGVRRALTVDHVVPRSSGGSDDISNLQTLCQSCNARKGARP